MLEETEEEGNLTRILRLWPLALLACCVFACCVPCICCCIQNNIIIKEKRAVYDKASDIAKIPLGEIEYSIKGKAPWLLCLHGTPGCHDGFVGDFDKWIEHGFGVIAPSRPNYGRTKLTSGS